MGGGCSVAGLGRFWIEFEVTCYHCANNYFLQPIPTGPLTDDAVSPGGGSAFDLNSKSGVQKLCSPLTYPRVAHQLADGTAGHQPGWIEPLGRFALVADSYPGAVHGIRLPSAKQFNLKTPAGAYPRSGLPMIALSADKVYVESNRSLWAAPVS